MQFLCVYPYDNIDSNPTMWVLLDELAQRGHRVDVLTTGSPPGSTPVAARVRFSGLDIDGLNVLNARGRIGRRLAHAAAPLALATLGRRYHAVLGVDPAGLAAAHHLDRWRRAPLAYISFELMFEDELREWERPLKEQESQACRDVELVLIQDERRAQALRDENRIERARCELVPNAPAPRAVPRSDWLREQLGIARDQRIVLHAGSPAAFSGRDQFVDMVASWPDDMVLVLHSKQERTPVTDQLTRWLESTGKILCTHAPLSRQGIPRLFSAADFGLASYRPTFERWQLGRNISLIGRSSGKLAYYAMCGLPVLTSASATIDEELARFDFGRSFRWVQETGPALRELDVRYPHHAQASRRYYEQCLDPTEKMARFCTRLEEIAT